MNVRERMDKGLEIVTNNLNTPSAIWDQQIDAKTQEITRWQRYDVKKPADLDLIISVLKIPKKDLPAGRRAIQKMVKARIDVAIVKLQEELAQLNATRKYAGIPNFSSVLPFCTEFYLLGIENNNQENLAALLKKHNLEYKELINILSSQSTVEERIESYRPEHDNDLACWKFIADAQIEIINSMQLTGSNNEILIKQFILESLKCAIKVKNLVGTALNAIIRDCFLNKDHFVGYKAEDVYYPPLAKIHDLISPIQPARLLTIFIMTTADFDLKVFQASIDKSLIQQKIQQALPELSEEQSRSLVDLILFIAPQVSNYIEHAALMSAEITRACHGLGIQDDFSVWCMEIFTYLRTQLLNSYVFPHPQLSIMLIKQEFGIIGKALKDPEFYIKPDFRSYIEAQTEHWGLADLLKRFESLAPGMFQLSPQSTSATTIKPMEQKPTPEDFYQACAVGASKKVKWLLRSQPSKKTLFNSYKDTMGRTAFLIAVVNNHVKVVEYLLRQPAVHKNVVDGQGNSASTLATTPEMQNLFNPVIAIPARPQSLSIKVLEEAVLPTIQVTEAKLSLPEETEKTFADYHDFFTSTIHDDEVSQVAELMQKLENETLDADKAERLIALTEKADLFIQLQTKFKQGAVAILKRRNTPEVENANLAQLRSIYKEFKKTAKGFQRCHQELQLFESSAELGNMTELTEPQIAVSQSSTSPTLLSPSWNATRSFFSAQLLFSHPESAEEAEAKKQVHQDFEDIRTLSRINVEDLANEQKIKFFNSGNIIPSMHINALSFKLIQFMEKRKSLNNLSSAERQAARFSQNVLTHSMALYNETFLVATVDNPQFITLYSDILFYVNRLIKSFLKKEPALLKESRFHNYLLEFGADLNKKNQAGQSIPIPDTERLSITQALEKQRLAYSFYVIAQDNPTITMLRDCALQMLAIKQQIYGILPQPLIAPRTLVLEQGAEEEKKFAPSRA